MDRPTLDSGARSSLFDATLQAQDEGLAANEFNAARGALDTAIGDIPDNSKMFIIIGLEDLT